MLQAPAVSRGARFAGMVDDTDDDGSGGGVKFGKAGSSGGGSPRSGRSGRSGRSSLTGEASPRREREREPAEGEPLPEALASLPRERLRSAYARLYGVEVPSRCARRTASSWCMWIRARAQSKQLMHIRAEPLSSVISAVRRARRRLFRAGSLCCACPL